MYAAEWSRSRFWLCHFLNSRHERLTVAWGRSCQVEQAVRGPLGDWLLQLDPTHGRAGAWLVGRLIRQSPDDPAFIQVMRLIGREGEYHRQLVEHAALHMGVTRRPSPAHMRWVATPTRITTAIARLLGERFVMSVVLLGDLAELGMMELIHTRDAAVRDAFATMMRDKRSHVTMHVERLTFDYADFNFIRRNLRRLRLRAMHAAVLGLTAWRCGRLIRATGHTRRSFVTANWRRFSTLLEQMVPYHRAALLKALLDQRESPYAKPGNLTSAK